jgi:hypothetical protein
MNSLPQQLMKPEPGHGLLLLRHIPLLRRGDAVYLYPEAYSDSPSKSYLREYSPGPGESPSFSQAPLGTSERR